MTDGSKLYQLDKGTILDGRYEIGGVLGEGGFGITYAGTNIRVGREVAIKEFFCLDYMGRANDGISVVLTDRDAQKRFNAERGRFMREARILGEFKDEPGVVTVLDYFESGGTAYLVMEYLDGATLHEYVKTHGPYDPKVFFEEIRPLMHTLAKVHEAGVIHRDISPDNIMRMEDGSVVLIDFGSAKDLSGKTVTTATTYKDGFAPPEQYAAGKKLGPETDIYALAATFYYCLTGVKPESAIQRIMLDELRPLHELAGGIPEDIEQMTAKGMSLMQTDRFRSVTEMEDIIEARYPLLSPEEKECIRKRKKMRRRVLAAAAVVLLALLTVNIVRNSTLYRMRMQDTQMVYLDWESSDADAETIKEKDKADETIRNRLEVLAGKNNYLWNNDGKEGMIAVEVPDSVLKDNEPADLFRKYITRPVTNFTVMYADKEGAPAYYEDTGDEQKDLPQEDITKYDIGETVIGEGVIPTGDETRADLPYLKIVLKNPSSKMAEEFLNEKGKMLTLLIKHDNASSFYIPGFAEGDGRSIYLIPQESVDEEGFEEVLHNAGIGDGSVTPEAELVEGESFRAVLKYDIEHDSAGICPGVIAEPSVKWETPDNILAGDNQVTESEIKGKAILTEWTCGDYETPSVTDWINTIAVLRERLDALGVPYAFGVAPYDENKAAVKFAEEDVSQAELLMLEGTHYISLYNIKDEEESIYNSRMVKVGSGAEEHVEINDITSYTVDDVKEYIQQARKSKIDTLSVGLGYDGAYPLGHIKLSEVTDEQIDSGRLPLSEFGVGGSNEEDGDARDRLIELVNVVMNFSASDPLYLQRTAVYDDKGRFEKDVNLSEIKGGFYPECQELADRMSEEIQAASGNDPGFKVEVDVSGGRFCMNVYDGSLTLEGFEKEAVKRAEYLFAKYNLADYGVVADMRISNAREVKAAGGKGVEKMARFYFERFGKYYNEDRVGEYGLRKSYNIQIVKDGERAGEEEETEATALLDKLIRKSDILGKLVE